MNSIETLTPKQATMIARQINARTAPYASVEVDNAHLVVFNDVNGLFVRDCEFDAKLALDTAFAIYDRYKRLGF